MKVMIVELVKVGNANTTSVIPELELINVARSYFVGIVLRSSIKVTFEFV